MGEVYRARDTRLERTVAVKVLPANLSSDPLLRQRLEREARAVSKLSHPHICTLHDIGHQDGVDFLVMELVEGETSGAAPLADVLTEMTAEQAKLTVEGTIVGTFQYMAPEQWEGKEADARTDIFAMGELSDEMATGKPAFSGKSRASLIAAILTAEPAAMAALQPMTPPALERVVKKCLAKEPDERWQSASDLASDLNWIAEGGSQAVEARRVPLRRKTWELMPWLLAGSLLLLLIGTGAAWWKASNGRSARPMYFHTSVPFSANDLAMSPNGRTLAMVAYSTQVNNYALLAHEVGSRRTT